MAVWTPTPPAASAVKGQGQFSALNLTTLLEKPTIPKHSLNGHYELDLDSIGPNLAAMYGSASLSSRPLDV